MARPKRYPIYHVLPELAAAGLVTKQGRTGLASVAERLTSSGSAHGSV